jgi:hypothetical protein
MNSASIDPYVEWERGSILINKGGQFWYTDGSKTNKALTGARMNGHGMKQRLSFSLRQYTTLLQAEVYAIKACDDVDSKRGYWKRNTHSI